MPKPGAKPEKEFRATYNKFRANFQCNLSDLADIIYISLSNDETGVVWASTWWAWSPT